MEKRHRQRITDNAQNLRELIDFDVLLPELKQSGIFTYDMLSDVQSCGSSNPDRLDTLLKFLIKRGPRAYDKFMNCLTTSGHTDALNLLNNSGSDEWDGKMIQASNLIFSESVYRMRSKPRGVALVLSYIDFDGLLPDRVGGEIDVKNLQSLFTELGFEVDIHRNLTSKETKTVILSFKDDPRHEKADASIICCLSHGVAKKFYCSDHNLIEVEWMLEQFNNENCKKLHLKPKIFLLQHCRGDETDNAIQTDGGDWFSDSAAEQPPTSVEIVQENVTLATWSDMKICYSTSKNKQSFRSKQHGTIFIHNIAQVFRRRAHQDHLDDMLIKVTASILNEEYQGCKQSTEIKSRGWQKQLYFNPGL